MPGNVDEWVQDGCHSSYDGAPADSSAWENDSGSCRMNRGGSWSLQADRCRSAARDSCDATSVFNGLGFRLLMDV